jgi:hypothetical protein
VEPGDTYLDYNERDVFHRLKSFDEDLFRNWDAISSNRYFDMLYWLIKYPMLLGRGFSDNPDFRPVKVLERLCESIYGLISHMTEVCLRLDEISNMAELRVAFKMALFLGFLFMNSTVVKKKGAQGDIIA